MHAELVRYQRGLGLGSTERATEEMQKGGRDGGEEAEGEGGSIEEGESEEEEVAVVDL